MTMAPVQTTPARIGTRYIWHPRVHEEWAKEQLYFWRLHFSSAYEPRSIAGILIRLFKAQNVLSYAVYEAAGMWDFFVRVWLPTSVNVDQFEQAIVSKLERLNLNTVDKFRVTKTLLHWAWTDKQDLFQTPNANALARPLSDADIEKINHSKISDMDVEKLRRDWLIAPCAPTIGIKFISMLTEPQTLMPSREAPDAIAVQLREILKRASGIQDQSLYQGEGSAQFLVAGRVAYEDFDLIYNDLVKKVYESHLDKFLQNRMYTHIVVRSAMDAGFFDDRLATSEEVEDPASHPIEYFLAKQEGEELEFKGSAFLNVKRWVHDGTTSFDNKIALEGVLRAITGMLNTRGGVVIIGVLEKDKFKDKTSKDKLGIFPEYGENILFGLELDYRGKNWDAYQLRLLNLINAHIDPFAKPWVGLKQAEFEGREFALFHVREPSEDWFYLK